MIRCTRFLHYIQISFSCILRRIKHLDHKKLDRFKSNPNPRVQRKYFK